MLIGDIVYTERSKAAEHLGVLARRLPLNREGSIDVGKYAGFNISLHTNGMIETLYIKGKIRHSVLSGDSKLGLITRMENELNKLPKYKEEKEQKLADLNLQLKNAKIEIEKPFSEQEKLRELLNQKTELDLALEFKQDGDEILCFEDGEVSDNEAINIEQKQSSNTKKSEEKGYEYEDERR